MKKVISLIVLNFIVLYSFSQENCDPGYFLVKSGSNEKVSYQKIEEALKTLDKNCIEKNAEYSEMANEYVFHCLTYSSCNFLKVLSQNTKQPFYAIVLNEIENPVSDIYEFEKLYCNVVEYNKRYEDKVGDDVLATLQKWIFYFIPKSNIETKDVKD
jgi:hypothetical protein